MASVSYLPIARPTEAVDGRGIFPLLRDPLISDFRIGDFAVNLVTGAWFGPKTAAGWAANGLVKGDKGWSPLLATVADGARRVLQLVDWAGGQGTKPAANLYLGAAGLVSDIADATDIRGAQGPQSLISELPLGGDEASYSKLVALGAAGEDNEAFSLAQFFGPAGKLDFVSIAAAEALAVPASIKTALIWDQTSGLPARTFRRVTAEPVSGTKFRSADRFMPDGLTDAASGGWWGEQVPVATPAQIEAATSQTALVSAEGAKRAVDTHSPDSTFLASGGAFPRSSRVRWGDMIELAEFIDPASGSHAANAARINALLADPSRVTDRTVLRFPKGFHRLRSLNFPNALNHVRVVGEWPATVLEFDNDASWLNLGLNYDYFAMGGLMIQKAATLTPTTGYAIELNDGNGWFNPKFEDIAIVGAYSALRLGKISNSSSSDYCHRPKLVNVASRDHKADGIVIGGCYDPLLIGCQAATSYTAAETGRNFFITSWVQGGYFDSCLSIGNGICWLVGDTGMASVNAYVFNKCVGDQGRLYSLLINLVDRMQWMGGYIATQRPGARGVGIGNNARDVTMTSAYIENVATHGAVIEAGARRTKMLGCSFISCGLDTPNLYHGLIAANGAQDFDVSHCTGYNKTGYYSGQQAYGVAVGAGCDNFSVTDNDLRGNATGGLFNGAGTSASKIVRDNRV